MAGSRWECRQLELQQVADVRRRGQADASGRCRFTAPEDSLHSPGPEQAASSAVTVCLTICLESPGADVTITTGSGRPINNQPRYAQQTPSSPRRVSLTPTLPRQSRGLKYVFNKRSTIAHNLLS